MARRRRRLIGLVASVLVVAALASGYAAYRRNSRIARTDAVEAGKGDVTQTVSSISASVQPRLEITVASERSGRVAQLRARLGQRVEEGEVVAVLAGPVLEAELSQAALDVDRARKKLERARALSAGDALSRADLEMADFDFQAAAAKLTTLQARRRELTIRAPISGCVTAEHVKLGELLGRASEAAQGLHGFPIVTLSTLDDFVVKAYVDEVDVLRVRQGQEALIAMEALLGTTFVGVVSSVAPAPAARATGTTYEVLVTFKEPPERLVAGVRAAVRVVVARASDVVRVPREAVFPCDAGRCVFVPDGERARRRRVETGISDATHVEIRSGLAAGDRVLVGFPEKLREGAQIALHEVSR